MISFAGPIYSGSDVPFIVKITAGVTLYPELTVIDPALEVFKQDLTVLADLNGSVVDPLAYVGAFKTYSTGIHYFKVTLYSDAGKTVDVTATRLADDNDVGSFVTILNPIDELVVNHQSDGSVGYYLYTIMNYLLLFENIGEGECPVEIKVKNGQGVAFEVKDLAGAESFARDVLDSNGRAIVYLDKGTYKVEFYPPCGKEMEDSYKIITVNCQDSMGPNC
jgi:hypothetical protein